MITLKPHVLRLTFSQLFPIFLFFIAYIVAFSISDFIEVSNLILTLILILITLIFIAYILSLVKNILRLKRTTYTISNELLSYRSKLFSESRADIPTSQVTNLSYSISFFLDKMFKTGTLSVYTSGSGMADLVLPGVRDIENTYDEINEYLQVGKSQKISSSGEFVSGEKSGDFIKRVKPNVAIALAFTLSYTLIFAFFFGIQFTGLFLVLLQKPIFSIVISIGLILAIIIFIFLLVERYKRVYYDFYTKKLEYYDGFLTLKKVTVPIERITNIDSRQGIFQRILGISTIQIETAGSSGSELRIQYVLHADQIISELKEVLKKHGRN